MSTAGTHSSSTESQSAELAAIRSLQRAASLRVPPQRAHSYHRVRFAYDVRRAKVWHAAAAYLQRFVDYRGSLLDLGAGYGEFSRFICASGKWALDANAELAKYWGPEVEPLIQSALEPLPLETASVQTVFASNFFEHFTHAEIELILSEAKRVLRPGGTLLVVQPNFRLQPRRYFDDYTHKTVFSDTSFRDLLESLGWAVEHVEPRFLPFSLKTRLPVWRSLVLFYLALPFRPFAGQFLAVAKWRGESE